MKSCETRRPREHNVRYQRSIRKHQKSKSTSTGGGRAWSEEEEMYLLQSRLRKIPYKAIAAHLHKTDLACRLHYHQLGNPNNRHERTPSISSSSVASQPSDLTPLQSTSTVRRDSSPGITFGGPAWVRSTSIETVSIAASPPHSHVTILPRPVSSPSQRWNPLRLDTTDLSAYQPHATSKIDEVRLRRVYRSRYPHFWSLIAADYGSDVAPATLEKAWCNMSSTVTSTDPLPTPCVSPRSPTAVRSSLAHLFGGTKERDSASRFHAINQVSPADRVATVAEKSTFAISSLLTEEKEVRNPKRGGSQGPYDDFSITGPICTLPIRIEAIGLG